MTEVTTRDKLVSDDAMVAARMAMFQGACWEAGLDPGVRLWPSYQCGFGFMSDSEITYRASVLMWDRFPYNGQEIRCWPCWSERRKSKSPCLAAEMSLRERMALKPCAARA